MLDLERGLVYHRKLGRLFTGDGRFIAYERRFDFRRADCNDVSACLGSRENQFSGRFRFL